MKLDDMHYGKMVRATKAIASLTEVDISAAEKMPRIVAIIVEKNKSGELPKITYNGEIICTIAGESEEEVNDALTKVKISYDEGTPQMDDRDPANASGRDQAKESGDVAAGFEIGRAACREGV